VLDVTAESYAKRLNESMKGGVGVATLTEMVAEVLRDEGKLSAVEIFGYLPTEARLVTQNEDGLETELRANADTFVFNSHTGEWGLRSRLSARSVRPDAATRPVPSPPERGAAASQLDLDLELGQTAPRVARRHRSALSPSTRRPRSVRTSRTMLLDPPAGPVGDLERELRDRLLGRRIIAEIGLDAALHERVEETLEGVLKVRWTDDELSTIPQRYPALLATYLVSHGVYRYNAGDFWGSISVPGLDGRAGVTFETSVALLGLETFEDLVAGDHATRFIAPILAHGGIPKYCLGDYFDLLLRDLGKVDGDAADLMAFWRTRKSAFFGVDKPVRRFLLYGGDLAVDFLDRTIDMVRGFEAVGTVGRPEEIGLPPYVVLSYKRRATKSPERRDRTRARRIPRPEIRLDPWAPFGPEIELPQLPADVIGASWRIHTAGQIQRVAGSNHELRAIPLVPAAAWTAELHVGKQVERETSFEGFDAVAALFFDPSDGRLLSPAAGFRSDQVWVLAPTDAEVLGVGTDGKTVALSELDELPEPTGAWSGFRLTHVGLTHCRAVQVRAAGADRERRVSVRPRAERPELVGSPLDRVFTDSGLPVFAELPVIQLPDSDLDDSQWFVNLKFGGERHSLAVSDLAEGSGFDGLIPATWAGEIDLVVQGPLGADLRSEFVYVPGLSVQMPERLLFPDDAAGDVVLASPFVHINGEQPGVVVSLPVPNRGDEIRAVVGSDSSDDVNLVVRIAKVMWGLVRQPRTATDLSNEPVGISDNEIDDGDVVALSVRTRQFDLPLELSLLVDNVAVQVSDRATTGGGEGRWLFDLKRFADTIRSGHSPNSSLVLRVGVRPVTVANIRLSWGVRIIDHRSRVAGDFASVDVEFEADRELTDRVIRLWSLDRLWEGPIVERIPDGPGTTATVSGYDRIPAGRYVVELGIDDGWAGLAIRPGATAEGVASIVVGAPSDVNDRLWRISNDNPFNVLEVALATGTIGRHLDGDELSTVMPAAVRSALVMIEHADARVLTSRGFSAVLAILQAGPEQLARALVEVAEGDQVAASAMLRLVIELAGSGDLEIDTADGDVERLMRSLWAVNPAAAAIFDVGAMRVGQGQDRAREFVGWDPDDDLSAIVVGEPVDQLWMGITAEQLESIQRSIDLIPNRVLAHDAHVSAVFEWLLAYKADPAETEAWWREAHRIVRAVARDDEHVAAHLDARCPPAGTVPIAGVPQAILAAALVLTEGGPAAEWATKQLAAATTFAPQLVAHDLVLARILANPVRSTS